MTARLLPSHRAVTLGILAGGRGTRLGGCDKAWLERDGEPLVMSLARRLAPRVDAVFVSANRNPEQYLSHGLRAIHDLHPDLGPISGLEALATACRSAWLLTLPVDVVSLPDDLVDRLSSTASGAFAVDDDGAQPLVALWRTDALRGTVANVIAARDYAVHALQSRLGMAPVHLAGVRLGNLNSPGDLAAAGIALP